MTGLVSGMKVGYSVPYIRSLPMKLRHLRMLRGTVIQLRRNSADELLAAVRWNDRNDQEQAVSVVPVARLTHCSSRSLALRRNHA